MIDALPRGKLIGTMQAPLSWIFTHTSRFVGVALVKIQDGDGIILIEKGQPRFFYYSQGNRALKGHAAKDYFSSQPVINFSLYKLSPEEFEKALFIADPDAVQRPSQGKPNPVHVPPQEIPVPPAVQGIVPDKEKSPPTQQIPEQAKSIPRQEPETPVIGRSPPDLFRNAGDDERIPSGRSQNEPEELRPVQVQREIPVQPQGEPELRAGEKTSAEGTKLHPDVQAPSPAVPDITVLKSLASEEQIPDVDLRAIAQILLGRIKTIPGVVAVMVFNKDMHIISIGDINLDTLVSSAEDMLMTVNELDTIMEWGSFVQMTIQVPSGSVIIAPFFNEYLCILTTPEINLGRIRRILREIKLQQNRS